MAARLLKHVSNATLGLGPLRLLLRLLRQQERTRSLSDNAASWPRSTSGQLERWLAALLLPRCSCDPTRWLHSPSPHVARRPRRRNRPCLLACCTDCSLALAPSSLASIIGWKSLPARPPRPLLPVPSSIWLAESRRFWRRMRSCAPNSPSCAAASGGHAAPRPTARCWCSWPATSARGAGERGGADTRRARPRRAPPCVPARRVRPTDDFLATTTALPLPPHCSPPRCQHRSASQTLMGSRRSP